MRAAEIIAGLAVALKPRYGGLLVTAWPAGSSSTCSAVPASKTSPCATSACCWLHDAGTPRAVVPPASWADVRGLLGSALTVAFICVAQTAATVRAPNAGAEASRDFNQDLVALGAGSLAAGLSGSFAVNSSPPRTQIAISSGGRSQVTGLVAAAVVLGVLLLATRLLESPSGPARPGAVRARRSGRGRAAAPQAPLAG